MQYVCTGDARSLSCLIKSTDCLKASKDSNKPSIEEIVDKCASELPQHAVELGRGQAAIPLPGIEIPFHSSLLSNSLDSFRAILKRNIPYTGICPRLLIGKYVPNLTGMPFELTREYFELVYSLTNSSNIAGVLECWDDFRKLG